MVHAFEWLGDGQRWLWLGMLFVAVFGLAVTLKVQGRPLEKAGASILEYEFAWDREGAARVLGRWDTPTLQETARKQLLLDFPFLLVYPVFLSLACAMLSGAPGNAMAGVGIFLSWALLAALPLDAAENLALLRMLPDHPDGTLARLATLAAGAKFTLVYAGLGYLVLEGLGVLGRKLLGGS